MRDDFYCPECDGDGFDVLVEWGSINRFECDCGHEWNWKFDVGGQIIEETK